MLYDGFNCFPNASNDRSLDPTFGNDLISDSDMPLKNIIASLDDLLSESNMEKTGLSLIYRKLVEDNIDNSRDSGTETKSIC